MDEDEKIHLAEQLAMWSAVLSLLGCTFVIASYLLFRNLRMFPFKLVCYMSCVELGISVVGLSLSNHDAFQCQLKGALADYLELCSMTWNAIIAFNIWQILCRRNPNVQALECTYHLIAWGVPAALWLPVMLHDKFGPAGIWCWIPPQYRITRTVFFYIPWAVSVVLTLVLYWHIGSFLLRSSRDEKALASLHSSPSVLGAHSLTAAQERQVIARLSLYVLVYVVVSLFPFVNRFDELTNKAHWDKITTAGLLHAALRPLLGFLNSIVYGVNRRLINEYKGLGCTRRASGQADVPYRSLSGQGNALN